ncbi:monocarboxylate permease-like protein [Xylogone sp. PMI_703]|nr:monocarboxylate permease-like protein [Xylogone sp. PMI_703]
MAFQISKNSGNELSDAGQIQDPSSHDYDSPEIVTEKDGDEVTFPEGGARAWGVAIGTAGVLFCTFGFANSFGIFQEYYQTHQLSHETSSTISWIGSVQIFFLFSGSLFGGPLFDRYGSIILWPATITYVFSVMMTSLCKSFYQFLLAQGFLSGFTMGMAMAPCMAATSQYFNKKRGAAMGIAVAGSSLGGVIFPIALNKMLNDPNLTFGWTVRICGFIMLALLLPSTLAIRARLPPRSQNLFLPSAFKEPPYTILIVALIFVMLGVFIPIFYLPIYAVQHGMGTQLALYLTAILNAASFAGRVIPGVTADKVGRLNMLTFVCLSTGILCLCWQKTSSNASILVFAGLYGFSSGAVVSLLPVCFAQIPKNPQDIGTYMGMGMFCVSFASLVGPPINGALVTHYKGYTQSSIFSGVMILTGGFIILLLKYITGKGFFVKV